MAAAVNGEWGPQGRRSDLKLGALIAALIFVGAAIYLLVVTP